MTTGEWRDGFPGVSLTLIGEQGPFDIDFVIDTGFNGDIALPERLMSQLGISPTASHYVERAGGFRQRCFSYEMLLEWGGEERLVREYTRWRGPVRAAINLGIVKENQGEIQFGTRKWTQSIDRLGRLGWASAPAGR